MCSQSSVFGLLFLRCHPSVSCMRLSLLMPVCHSEPPLNQASMYNHLAGLGINGHLTGTFRVNSSPVPCVPASNGCRVLLSAQVGYRIPPSPGGRVTWSPTEEGLISNRTLTVNLMGMDLLKPVCLLILASSPNMVWV